MSQYCQKRLNNLLRSIFDCHMSGRTKMNTVSLNTTEQPGGANKTYKTNRTKKDLQNPNFVHQIISFCCIHIYTGYIPTQ